MKIGLIQGIALSHLRALRALLFRRRYTQAAWSERRITLPVLWSASRVAPVDSTGDSMPPGSLRSVLGKAAIYSLCAFLLTGCAGQLQTVDEDILHTWFALSIKDGRTGKEEALLNLGVPSDQFDGERILAYRLKFDREKGYVVVSREFDFIFIYTREERRGRYDGYHLILVFDEGHVLVRHSLIKVE